MLHSLDPDPFLRDGGGVIFNYLPWRGGESETRHN